MTRKQKITAIIVAGVILFLLWLLLARNKTAQQIIKQNLPYPISSLFTPSAPDTYNINMPGYVPANFPSPSTGKCDSNSPCVFCIIPNATYPSKPVSVSKDSVATDYIRAATPPSWTGPSGPDWVLYAH